jgi:EAL domain-containing protein (putative c-di-GMP-specific phosphodiesterase class I)
MSITQTTLDETPPLRAPLRAASPETDRRRLRRELVQAVEHGRFALHYQPRICLRTGRPLGAEALLRWPNGPRGMISPATFLPLAVEAGLAAQLGGWVLAAACNTAAVWPGEAIVSVNIARQQLDSGALCGQIATALETSGLAPERLELELPEDMLAGVDSDALLTLSALRDLGIGLALDDFGAGIASLSMLRRLPLTALKLDRSVVRHLPDGREDAAMAQATIHLAHMLGLTITAEGIETEAQRSFLATAGCDDGQGYLFSPPLPAERIFARQRA